MADTTNWLEKTKESYNDCYKTYRAVWCRRSGLPMMDSSCWKQIQVEDLYTVSRAKKKHVSIDMKHVRAWYRVWNGYVPMFRASRKDGDNSAEQRRALTSFERQQIYGKFGGHCAYCGCEITIKDMQADHVVPLHLGGADDISNLYPACRACNHYKSTYTVEKFRAVIQRALAVLMTSSAAYRSLVRFGLIKHPDNRTVQFYFERNSEND